MNIKKKQNLAKGWFLDLQNIICNTIEKIEKDYGSNAKFKKINGSMVNLELLKGE